VLGNCDAGLKGLLGATFEVATCCAACCITTG
jgi:hypothetical protein